MHDHLSAVFFPNFNFTRTFCILFRFRRYKFYLFYLKRGEPNTPRFAPSIRAYPTFNLEHTNGDSYSLWVRLPFSFILFGVLRSVVWSGRRNIHSRRGWWKRKASSILGRVAEPKYLKGSNNFLAERSYCLAIIVSRNCYDYKGLCDVCRIILTSDGVSCSEKKEVSQDFALANCCLFLELHKVWSTEWVYCIC
jgi:hypothetical protein